MAQFKKYSAEEIALNSAHLEAFFDRERVRMEKNSFDPPRVATTTLWELKEWSTGSASHMLWIDGPCTDVDRVYNRMSLLGATFINLASESHVPIISYFCDLPREHQLRPDSDESKTRQGLVALVSALLRQMVEHLLSVVETEIDLTEARFRLMNGTSTPKHWDDAMAMFRDLATLMPEKVFCVIDGLHWFDGYDDDTAEPCLAELIQVLRDCKFKVLWTTTGRSAALLTHIPLSEALQLDSYKTATDFLWGDDFFGAGQKD